MDGQLQGRPDTGWGLNLDGGLQRGPDKASGEFLSLDGGLRRGPDKTTGDYIPGGGRQCRRKGGQ